MKGLFIRLAAPAVLLFLHCAAVDILLGGDQTKALCLS